MWRFIFRYPRIPLATVCVLLLLPLTVWLLAGRVDGVLEPTLRLGDPPVAVVPLSPGPPTSSEGPPVPSAPDAPPVPGPRVNGTPATTNRYALESGPFKTAESADRLEERVNYLGHATVRFRKQDVTRLYVVAVTGFATAEEATRVAQELGRGVVLLAEAGAEVVIDRLGSLRDAVATARPLQARGLPVRVSEGMSPTVIYHIRYGQFEHRADAERLGQLLAAEGIRSRVVKVR